MKWQKPRWKIGDEGRPIDQRPVQFITFTHACVRFKKTTGQLVAGHPTVTSVMVTRWSREWKGNELIK